MRRRLLAAFLLGAALWGQAFRPDQERAWRSRIKSTLFVPDPLPPLEAAVHSRFEPAPGVVAERITYNTQFGLRIPAILYLPKSRPGKIPALVVVNGHGGDKYSWYSFYSANWSEAGIRRLPKTHVSEWARSRGVEMDPGYSSEQREGGTPALGEGVPGLSHEDLSLFSPEEWERQMDRMIQESWVAAAKTRLASSLR